MTPLLKQFIQEGRDFLQGIAGKLIELEKAPDSVALMTELFRFVHTLKGNSGLFEFPEMTRVLHAGEDLLDAVRDKRVPFTQQLADQLLDAMDFVSMLFDEIETHESVNMSHVEPSNELAETLRALIIGEKCADPGPVASASLTVADSLDLLANIPEKQRFEAWRRANSGEPLFLIVYRPEAECFFKGEDPLHQVQQVPGLLWGSVVARNTWPPLTELDCYSCQLDFHLLVAAKRNAVDEFFRYTPEQISIDAVDAYDLVTPEGHPNGGPVYGDFVAEALTLLDNRDYSGLAMAARTMLELSSPEQWLSSALRWLQLIVEEAPHQQELLRRVIGSLNTLQKPDLADLKTAGLAIPVEATPSVAATTSLSTENLEKIHKIISVQAEILALSDAVDWLPGRLKSVAATLKACLASLGEAAEEIDDALRRALAENSARFLREWLKAYLKNQTAIAIDTTAIQQPAGLTEQAQGLPEQAPALTEQAQNLEVENKFGRRSEDTQLSKVLKVDQEKIDRLMDLIGEMVVAKNSLPYLANRAEVQFGVREISREIKAQYAVINRIAEEMQDAIMQVRMTPVSFVFQRFPRMVRDISRKLGKEVELLLEGGETEADKNIIEALADPLMHIVRNSLDHGLETPDVREAAGKPRTGRLILRASQESDRVLLEIIDDGRGINPAVIKQKAYEKGVIDEATLERISDQDAINLVFAAGFSTAEAVSDLSGRGVGMDVVRSAIDKVGGAVSLNSQTGKGTTLSMSLPLSMAVTNVMIIESDRQIFGVPMDLVVETVRLPLAEIQTIKRQKTTVLRGSIVPLVALNELLEINAEPLANADNELAVLVVRVGNEQAGLLVDNFREVVDVILKPLPGELARLKSYAGTALLGDGSVLMVLNPKELF